MKKALPLSQGLIILILALLSTGAFTSWVQARDVTLSWTANSEPVDGYRLYYKTGQTGGEPYNGTGAVEGDSPISTGDVTTFTLTGLSDTATYYFVITAYAGTQESDYSTELSLLPQEPSPDTPISVSFSWLPNQEADVAGYKIHYGTTSGLYSEIVDIGNPSPVDGRIHGQVVNLTEGTTYYFVSTAYNSNGQESEYSDEITWTATAGTGANTPPVATSTSATTNEDQALTGTISATNDSGLPIHYQITQDVTHGQLLLETANGKFTYTPQENYSGKDSFTFQAIDDNGTSATATCSITITALNDPPTAETTTITVNEDTSFTGQLMASDPDGDTITFTVLNQPAHGVLNLLSSGSFTYTPANNSTAADSFTFQVSDGHLTSPGTAVNISITPVNDIPVASDGTLTAFFEHSTTGSLSASDVDNEPVTYTLVSDPAHIVTITNATTGAFVITPTKGMSSPYSFTFTAKDKVSTSNPATIRVTLLQPGTVTETFGDTPGSSHPHSIIDTYTNLNEEIKADDPFISTWTWSSSTPHKPANTIIIKADLSSLPDDVQISEAKLYLYQTSATGKQDVTNSIHKITGKNPIISQVTGENAYNGEPWTAVEPGTTYKNIPLGLADIGPAEDTVTLGTTIGYQVWTITNMAQDWKNSPETNYGLMITSPPTEVETGRTFASSDNKDSTIRPKLVLRYLPKPPKPTITSAKKIN